MKVIKAWAVILLVIAAWIAITTDQEYRADHIERCAVVHCV